jgi:hypothetical protein
MDSRLVPSHRQGANGEANCEGEADRGTSPLPFLVRAQLIFSYQTLVDIDLFTDIRRIETALAHQSCTEALAWCSENKASLRKAKVAPTIRKLGPAN